MAEESTKKSQRRITYIYKEYQRGFIVKFCAVALGAICIASLLLFILSRDTITATYRYHHLALQRTSEAILWPLLITNAIVLVCFLVATIIVTKYVSHKIGGPLWKFGKKIEDIGQGDLKVEIHLRRNDQLKDFASQINLMTRNLREKVCEVEGQAALLRIKAQSPNGLEEGLGDDVERLCQTISRLFKTQ
ncbi:MAG: methyl-accepting chemotaxis protein [Syntrophobacteraceae bacterium]|nr:methyl-accepting chemotaxis protein [Syntrophobacteraceae bacterium]